MRIEHFFPIITFMFVIPLRFLITLAFKIRNNGTGPFFVTTECSLLVKSLSEKNI